LPRTLPIASSHWLRRFRILPKWLAPAQLEALSGEYTNPIEPDTPLSFYVQDGKLMEESERMVPTELKFVSATEFRRPDEKTPHCGSRSMPQAAARP
jgi:hypothetical protein